MFNNLNSKSYQKIAGWSCRKSSRRPNSARSERERERTEDSPAVSLNSESSSLLWSAAAERESALSTSSSFAMELESYYEISRTADYIHTRNFTRVALQVLLRIHKYCRFEMISTFLSAPY